MRMQNSDGHPSVTVWLTARVTLERSLFARKTRYDPHLPRQRLAARPHRRRSVPPITIATRRAAAGCGIVLLGTAHHPRARLFVLILGCALLGGARLAADRVEMQRDSIWRFNDQ